MTTTADPNVGTLAGVTDESNDIILEGRYKDVASANSGFQSMWIADLESSRNRALIDANFDNMPPYGDGEQRLTGRADECNVNWGFADAKLREAFSPYPDLFTSVDMLMTCPTKYMPDDPSRPEWEAAISEEMTRMIRAFRPYTKRHFRKINEFIKHGVAIVYWPDDEDWRPNVAGLQMFKFPRQVEADEGDLSECGCKVSMKPSELWAKIKDPEIARARGWNVEACRKALMDAAPIKLASYDWEQWEQFYKGNDFYLNSSSKRVTVVHMWVEEVTGKVTHLIFREDGEGEFLYEKLSKFEAMDKCFVLYDYGVGTNGHLHSIRGLGHAIQSKSQYLNRTWSSFSDLVNFDSTPMLQPGSEDDLQQQAVISVGKFNVMATGWSIPERKIPDYDRTLLPAIQGITQLMESHASPFTQTLPSETGSKAMTKAQFQGESAHLSGITDSGYTLFYDAFQAELREIVRRACREDFVAQQPGGYAVVEMRLRLHDRGVPLQALYQVDIKKVEAVRAIGKGSPTAALQIMEHIQGYISAADPTGQQLFYRDMTMRLGGVQLANRYFPKQPDKRMPVDISIADLQNILLTMKYQIPVRERDNHPIHIQDGIDQMGKLAQQIDSDPSQIPVLTPGFATVYGHTVEHMKFVPANNSQKPQFNKAMQELGGILYNLGKHLQKLQKDQAGQPGGNPALGQGEQSQSPAVPMGDSGGSPQAGDPGVAGTAPGEEPANLLRQIVEYKTKQDDLSFQQAQHEQTMRHADEKFAQQLRLNAIKSTAEQ